MQSEYILQILLCRLILFRYHFLFGLFSFLAENESEGAVASEKTNEREKPDIANRSASEKVVCNVSFGARYYEPQTARWISPDPAFPEYLPSGRQVYFPEQEFNANSLKGSGGIFNFTNLNVYHYAGLNPIKIIDPNGRVQLDGWKSTYIGEHQGTEHLGDLTVRDGGTRKTIKINVMETGVYRLNGAGIPVERLSDKQSKNVLKYILKNNNTKHVTNKLAALGISKADDIAAYMAKSSKAFDSSVAKGMLKGIKTGGKLMGFAIAAMFEMLDTNPLNAADPLNQTSVDLGLQRYDTQVYDPVTGDIVNQNDPSYAGDVLESRRDQLGLEKTFEDSQ